jgi:hypothetical protein
MATLMEELHSISTKDKPIGRRPHARKQLGYELVIWRSNLLWITYRNFMPCRAGKIMRLHHTVRAVNLVYRNNYCLLWESYKTSNSLWAECRISNCWSKWYVDVYSNQRTSKGKLHLLVEIARRELYRHARCSPCHGFYVVPQGFSKIVMFPYFSCPNW